MLRAIKVSSLHGAKSLCVARKPRRLQCKNLQWFAVQVAHCEPMVKRLKACGYWVRGVDIKRPEFSQSAADDFKLLDLRQPESCTDALEIEGRRPDEIYQLAADMGGMGFIHSAECEIMRNNALINIHMIDAAAQASVPRYFFSSSVCIYRDMKPGEPELTETDAYPALPDNEYGWEKLYAERTAIAYGKRFNMAGASRVFKTVTVRRARGKAGARRHQQPSVARSLKLATAVKSKFGATAPPFAAILMSTIWSMAFIV